jgi:hypothetical protein
MRSTNTSIAISDNYLSANNQKICQFSR